MSEVENLLKDIEKLRADLFEIIEQKQFDLQDPEVQTLSREMNEAITKYNDFIRKKLDA